MSSEPARRTGRPPRLSRDAIVDAARAVIEAEGVERLTMRRIADKVGSSPMAIYRHVRDKDELLVAVLDRLVAELPRPRLPAEPRARLNRLWRFLHDGLAAHPWVAELLAQGDLMAPNVLPTLELITAASMASGLSEAESAQAYRIVWSFTVGHLLIQLGRARAREQLDRPTVQAQVRTQVDASRFPALAAVAPHWKAAASRDTYAADLATLLESLLPRP
jgi:AcrR family transcriptional regulator